MTMDVTEKRRALKQEARRNLKRHYRLFVIICLLASFIHAEYSSSLNVWDSVQRTVVEHFENADLQFDGKFPGTAELGQLILQTVDNKKKAEQQVDELKSEAEEKAKQSPILGRSRGVLAEMVNFLTSGQIFVLLFQIIERIVEQKELLPAVFMISGALIYLFIWTFFINVVPVVERRFFLEGRLYERIPLGRATFLYRTRHWANTAWILFRKTVQEYLWALTVVGLFIKHYEYLMIPYILAENPSLPAKEAFRLSREMTDGHKKELFLVDLTLLPWKILGIPTLGLSDIFFTNPYKTACFSEYYAELRSAGERLNDRYLFERAEDRLLQTAYPEAFEALETPEVVLRFDDPVRQFLADAFGIVLWNSAEEKAYQADQELRMRVIDQKQEATGVSYPTRLSPSRKMADRPLPVTLHFLRMYSLPHLIVIFFLFMFIGWLWEVNLSLINYGMFVNRGTLLGPWLPIYGVGGILILTVLKKFRPYPVQLFIAAVVLCGIIEYGTSWALETIYGLRWWDYTGYFLNLNGRICAEGLMVFGLGGFVIVYLVAPLIDDRLRQISPKRIQAVTAVLLLVFGSDVIYSAVHPNTGEGVIEEIHNE